MNAADVGEWELILKRAHRRYESAHVARAILVAAGQCAGNGVDYEDRKLGPCHFLGLADRRGQPRRGLRVAEVGGAPRQHEGDRVEFVVLAESERATLDQSRT